jgi:hypothetical protein
MLGCEEDNNVIAKVPLPALLLPAGVRKIKAKEKAAAAGKAPEAPEQKTGNPVGLFFRGMATPVVVNHDSELTINAPLAERTPFLKYNGRRTYTRLRQIPMQLVKAVCKRFGCTVNDALLAAWTGAIRRYGAEVRADARLKKEGEELEFKTMIKLGLPRKVDETDMNSALCNNMLFATCPLPIDQSSAEMRLEKTVRSLSNLKSRSYMSGLIGFTKFITSVAPVGVMRKAASETFSKHSMLISTMPFSTVPVTLPKKGGEEVQEVQMVFPNCIPQLSIITYNGHVDANFVADPELYPNPAILGDFWMREFEALGSSTGAPA